MRNKIGNFLGIMYWVLWGIGSIILGTIMLAGAIALGTEKITGKESEEDTD